MLRRHSGQTPTLHVGLPHVPICSTPGLCCRGVEVGLGFKPQGARRRAARLPFLSEKRETNSDLESEDLFHHIVFAFIMYTYIYIYTIQLKVLQHGFLKAIISKLNLV